MNVQILNSDDLKKLFGINDDEAKQLITDVNSVMRGRGKVTIKNRVLKPHLDEALGIKTQLSSINE